MHTKSVKLSQQQKWELRLQQQISVLFFMYCYCYNFIIVHHFLCATEFIGILISVLLQMTLADFDFFPPHNLRKIQKIISKNTTEYVYIVSVLKLMI